MRRRVDAIVRVPRARRSFATVVLPLESAAADYNDDLAAQTFLTNVSTDAKVRAASLQCSTDQSNVLQRAQRAARPVPRAGRRAGRRQRQGRRRSSS